ncbi:MAG: hypothetical protein HFJ53_08690 [Clostridia bacterium]|nr:hypothetical protein [Clostridia bacterium]
MILCEKLEKNLNCLNVLFQAQDEEIATITKEDREKLKETEELLKEEEISFRNVVQSILSFMKQTKSEIMNLFYDYIEIFNDRNSYFEQKYYEAGFKDAVALILRRIKK